MSYVFVSNSYDLIIFMIEINKFNGDAILCISELRAIGKSIATFVTFRFVAILLDEHFYFGKIINTYYRKIIKLVVAFVYRLKLRYISGNRKYSRIIRM